jgi:hypothetical protein
MLSTSSSSSSQESSIITQQQQQQQQKKSQYKYKSVIQNNIISSPTYEQTAETNYNTLEALLEKEKLHNKSDGWNKLNKTVKLQKLHQYAETYGHTNQLPIKDVKALKTFFNESLDKNKLQKTKDVVYDKEKGIITNVLGLFFNTTNRAFTLKSMDTKRVSTIKCLTPHKITVSPHQQPSTDNL